MGPPVSPDAGKALAEMSGPAFGKTCDDLANQMNDMDTAAGGLCAARGDPEFERMRERYNQHCRTSSSAQPGCEGEKYLDENF